MRISKGVSDECFVCGDLGVLIKIVDIIDVINGTDVELEAFSCPIEELLQMKRADRLDRPTLEKMSKRRRDEPIVIAKLGGNYWIIDGNHRLERRRNDGFEDALVIEAPAELLEQCIAPL
jgi:hypothetical protein